MTGNIFPLIRSHAVLMIKNLIVVGILVAFFSAGCTDREAAARRAKEEAEAKARADAARNEMEALPKAFKSPQFFKLNEPEKKSEPASPSKKTNS